jgi:carbon-monoxide dehydrogenase medium subunit
VKPAPFQYYSARTLPEALARLAEIAPDDGRVLAGGQSLLPAMALRMARPRHLLDINRVAGLDRIAEVDGKLAIGARVRHAAFHNAVTPNPLGHLMRSVVPHIAHYPIRTRGTFCGSLAMADPASEWCCVAATLDAELVIHSVRGQRSIKARVFFQGFLSTDLQPDELLTEVRLPLLTEDTGFGFQEFSRRRGDYAMSMALATLRVIDGRIAEARVGVGGAEGCPRRIPEAEAALVDRPSNLETFQVAANAAAAAIDPIEDASTSADYRRELVQVLTLRALQQAAA